MTVLSASNAHGRISHWLIKSEPSTWSWTEQVQAGAKGVHWDGVRNHLAKKYLQTMRVGDKAFFYHSNQERAIVGIVEIIKPFYPDPGDASGKFGMVDVRALEILPHPVALSAIKAAPALAQMQLVTNSRLSVQEVSDEAWDIICAMGGLKGGA